jgi:glycosyltransferase involved in cell wall biosynthesis
MDDRGTNPSIIEPHHVAAGISVIIPLYNKAATVGRAIESVLRQVVEVEVEVVVVNDGSTDGSEAVVLSYGDHVRYLKQENAGPSAARNRGVEASRFPLLAFLDADDEFLPGCLSAHLECRRTFPSVKVTLASGGVIGRDRVRKDYRISNRTRRLVSQGAFSYTTGFLAEMVRGVASSSICIDKEVFDAIGGFDAELRCWENTDFMFRLNLTSPVIGILNDVYVLIHRDSNNSQFERARSDISYRKRYVLKVLDRIGEVPPDQRGIVFKKVKGTMRRFLTLGALDDFREILQQVDLRWAGFADLVELRLLNCIPYPVIRAALSARKRLRHFVGAPS